MDAAVEQTQFDRYTPCRAKILPSAQEAQSVRIRRQFMKVMPGWLRAKLLQKPGKSRVEDSCILARRKLSFHNLCKTDDFVMDAFSEM